MTDDAEVDRLRDDRADKIWQMQVAYVMADIARHPKEAYEAAVLHYDHFIANIGGGDTCTWKKKEDGYWYSTCGEYFSGSPQWYDHICRSCHRRIVEEADHDKG